MLTTLIRIIPQRFLSRSIICKSTYALPFSPIRRCLHSTSLTFQSTPNSNSSEETDGGAKFEIDQEPLQPNEPSLSESVGGEFRRTSSLGIMTPTRGSGSPTRRVDDPVSQARPTKELLDFYNKMNITSEPHPMVPVGGGKKGQTKKPQKGGPAIHPAIPVEQSGKLTPMQMHRIVMTRQANDPYWTNERIAAAYSVDVTVIESLTSSLCLPFVWFDRNSATWQGSVTEPTSVNIKRALGEKIETAILGDHLKIDKPQR